MLLTSCGGPGIPSGPSPLVEVEWLGEVSTRVQPTPGAEVRRHWMPVHQAPVNPPRAPAGSHWLADDELVVGVVVEGTAVAYPIRFLNLAEVVNDTVAKVDVLVTWCPLAGSATVFHRRLDESAVLFHFGAGLLHDNLVFVDEVTVSVWSQIGGVAVDGPLEARRLMPLPSLQTTWGYWRKRRPDTQVMFFPGEEGVSYHYADFDPANLPYPPPTRHDPSTLGLGLVTEDGTPWFLPFPHLRASGAAEGLRLQGTSWTVRFAEEGMTAWLEDTEGDLVHAQLAYERVWLPFRPERQRSPQSPSTSSSRPVISQRIRDKGIRPAP